jgi:hypothetical protein
MSTEYYELTAKGQVAVDDEGWMDSLEVDSAFLLVQVDAPVPAAALERVNKEVVMQLKEDGYIQSLQVCAAAHL